MTTSQETITLPKEYLDKLIEYIEGNRNYWDNEGDMHCIGCYKKINVQGKDCRADCEHTKIMKTIGDIQNCIDKEELLTLAR